MIQFCDMEKLGQRPLPAKRISELAEFFQKYKHAFGKNTETQDVLNFAELHPDAFDCLMHAVKKNYSSMAE